MSEHVLRAAIEAGEQERIMRAVREYTVAGRSAGLTCEAVVLALKQELGKETADGAPRYERQELRDRAVSAAIRAYYAYHRPLPRPLERESRAER